MRKQINPFSLYPLYRPCLTALLIVVLLTSCQPAPAALPPTATAAPATSAVPTETTQPTSTPAPSPTASEPFEIQIDSAAELQTILEMGGGNFVHRSMDIRTAFEPISRLNLKILNPKVVRVSMDIDEWEPKEGVEGEERFKDDLHVHATFDFMQKVKTQNPDTIFIASIWQVPGWMVSNPSQYSQRIIPPDRYDDVVDSIAHWLIQARDVYGVEVPYVSFNEANGGIQVLFKPEEYIELIRIAGPAFEAQGLTTRWLIGDASNITEAFSYGKPIWDAEDIRPYLGPFTFHSWDPQTPDSMLQQIGRFSDETGVEIWCTEGGWDPYQGQRAFEFISWKHALNLASIYTRVLREARATAMMYWQMAGSDFVNNNGREPYPSLVYISELQHSFPTGAKIVKTSDPSLFVLVLAANLPNGGFSVQLINQGQGEEPVALTGLPDGDYAVVILSEATQKQELEPVAVNESAVNLNLPPQSILFLTLKP